MVIPESADINPPASEHERVEKAAEAYAVGDVKDINEPERYHGLRDGFHAGVSWARANPAYSVSGETLTRVSAQARKDAEDLFYKLAEDTDSLAGWVPLEIYQEGHAAGAASREAQALELNELNENAIIALRKERDALQADLAGLVDALELLLLDMRDYEAWQKPCHAYVQAKEALARVRGKGGSK